MPMDYSCIGTASGNGLLHQECHLHQDISMLHILNNNFLTGRIPDKLSNCLSLDRLNVSYNNFTGSIPLGRNFSRFPPYSFIGNPLLCGHCLGSICYPYPPKSKVMFSRTAVVCITLGFITMLSMIVVAMYNINQRKPLIKGSSKSMQGLSKLVLHMDMAIHTYVTFQFTRMPQVTCMCACVLFVFSCVLHLRFATLDLELHTKYEPGGLESIYDVDRKVSQRTQVLPPIPEDRFLCSFSHIFAGEYAA